MDDDIVVEESLIKSVESRFWAVKEEAAARWLKLTYEKQKQKTVALLNSTKQQLSNQPSKFSSQEHVEQVLRDFMVCRDLCYGINHMHLESLIYRGYYTVARRYEVYLQVEKLFHK